MVVHIILDFLSINYLSTYQIGSTSWFCHKFRTARNVNFVYCHGILPPSLFEERFKDSSPPKLPNNGGIVLVRLFWEKLRRKCARSFPITAGIVPWKQLFEKSMILNLEKEQLSSGSVTTKALSWVLLIQVECGFKSSSNPPPANRAKENNQEKLLSLKTESYKQSCMAHK